MGFTKVRETVGTLRIPEWMFASHPHLVSTDADALRYTCPQCGLIEPARARNGYSRRECACARRAREMAEVSRLMGSTRHQIAHVRVSRTYTWLGAQAGDLEQKSFRNFIPATQRDAHSKALWYSAQIINGQFPGNLMLVGGFGTGKTHLAVAVLNKLRGSEPPIACLFCTAQGLFSALYALDFEEQRDLLSQAAETPLLVLDDLDKLHIGHREHKEDEGAYQRRMLFDLLNRRYLARLPTAITTNAPDVSPWLDGATLSRLNERMTVVSMVGPDYRSGEAE